MCGDLKRAPAGGDVGRGTTGGVTKKINKIATFAAKKMFAESKSRVSN